MERRDEVEVLLARLVVEQRTFAAPRLHVGAETGDPAAEAGKARPPSSSSGERAPRVARGGPGHGRRALVVDGERRVPPSPRSPSARARSSSATRSAVASGSSTTTRQRERSAPLSSNDGFSVVAPTSTIVAALDVREERVLLGAVEAVDLVDEEERAAAGPRAAAARLGHHLA